MTSREFRDRLAKRAKKADVLVSPDALMQLETYYRLLARWNDKINLTALPLRDLTDQAIDRLLIEPLAAARFVPGSPLTWFDLGSGGGSPALPLRIVRRAARLVMVETKARKAAFLREAVRALGLTDTTVETCRFEELLGLGSATGSAQLVTVRAVKVDERLLAVSSRLLSPAGDLMLFGAQPFAALPTGFETQRDLKLGSGSRIVIVRRTQA